MTADQVRDGAVTRLRVEIIAEALRSDRMPWRQSPSDSPVMA
jgi:hypothetical protein